MIELLFADCNCQSLTKKFPLRCQKFPHSSQISSQISVGFANFVDMGSSSGYFTAPPRGGIAPPLEKCMPPLGIEILGKVCL